MIYVPPLGGNPNDSYVEGNPTAGIRGSFPTATGYEAIMREICNLETLSGYQGASNANLAEIQDLYQAVLLMIKNNPSQQNTRYSAAASCGLSLETVGDQTIPVGEETTLMFGEDNVPAAIATYANGVLTMVQPGWYDFQLEGAFAAASAHFPDTANCIFKAVVSSGGGFLDSREGAFGPPNTPTAGGASKNFVTSRRQYLNKGDTVKFTVTLTNFYNDATNCRVVAFTNALLNFLNL